MEVAKVRDADLALLLRATMEIDLATRRDAEQRVEQLKSLPGFAIALCRLTLDQIANPSEVRQLAAVLLKQFVKRHWDTDADDGGGWADAGDEDGTAPNAGEAPEIVICEEEKAAVRAALPSGLTDPSTRIRTALSMAIASIAECDWPERWPSLMRELIAPLQASTAESAGGRGAAAASSTPSAAVAGSLRCLELCAAELQEEHIEEALATLMPLLLTMVAGPNPPPRRERARAVRVLHRLLERLCMLSSGDDPSVRKLQKGPLASWAAAALAELGRSAASPTLGAEWSLELALLRLLRLMTCSLPRAIVPHASAVLPPLGALLLRALRALEEGMYDGDTGSAVTAEGAYDSDGGGVDVAALASGLLDLLTAMAAASKLYRLLEPVLADVFHCVIGMAQIDPESEAQWEGDTSQYLQDEDPDSFAVTPRVAAQQAVDELLDAYGKRAAPALVKAISMRLEQAHQMRAHSMAQWWRLREAALATLALAAPLLGQMARRAARRGEQPLVAPEQLLNELLLPDAADDQPALLRARSLCAAARFSPHLSADGTRLLIAACGTALAPSQPVQLRLAACRALSDVCEAAESSQSGKGDDRAAVLAASASELLTPIVSLLSLPSEDAVLLSLETTSSLLRTNPELAAAAESWLAPLLLQLWSARSTEHLVTSAVVQVIRSLAESPRALPGLASRLLPAIAEVFQLQLRADSEHAARVAACSPAAGPTTTTTQGGEEEEDPGAAIDPLRPALELLSNVVLHPSTLDRTEANASLLQRVCTGVLPLLLQAMSSAREPELIRAGCGCLARMVRRGALRGDGRAGSTGDESSAMLTQWQMTLLTMLRPSGAEADHLADGVVPLVGKLILYAPHCLQGQGEGLVGAMVAWLGRARLLGLVQEILLVLSRVVHSPVLGPAYLVDRLSRLPDMRRPGALATLQGGEYGTSALPFVIRTWTETASEVLHPYTRRAILAALFELVSPRFPDLCSLPTAVESTRGLTGAARTTRSGARRGQQQIPSSGGPVSSAQIPLVVRTFQLSTRTIMAVRGGLDGGEGRRAAGRGQRRGGHGGRDQNDDDDDDEEEEEEEEGEEESVEEGEEEGEDEDFEGSLANGEGLSRSKGRPSPFVPADSVSMFNLSELLDDGSGEEDESDAGSDDDLHGAADHFETALDPLCRLDLGQCAAEYNQSLRDALGEQQFGQLCGSLADERERTAARGTSH